ncbi:Aste57867_5636 [Aphanomyces stellatus]|uniref:Aste57867_5636 protein n=1 Tax=Aphanomyces stellatus TaxID=120398 RepID=A0A485KDP9_9STRA|nr:hypothetical protein As57867_005623 [Aphanomyces stellatus]VFT82682.1 Aste57867_5636 [Aphanomyces stellatus]
MTAMGLTMNMNTSMGLRMPTHEENEMMCRGFDLPTTPTDANDPLNANNASGSFVTKLFAMVETEPDSVVTWIREGTAFCIVQPKVLAETFLPKYFRHGRFSSLIRQLNFYSFYKVTEGSAIIYQHSHFRKGRPDLLVHIKRRGAGKAKDPWVDPLSNKRYPSEQDAPVYVPLNNTMGPTDICSSPSSKPMSSQKPALMLNDNMSPALKPGTSPLMVPPVVDLSARKEVSKSMMKQPVRSHHLGSSTMFGLKENPSTGSLIAVRSFDQDIGAAGMKPPLWRTTSGTATEIKSEVGFMSYDKSAKAETTSDQIKNEMIDEAILDNLTFGDMMDASMQPHFQSQPAVDPRSMILARDCLKGPAAAASATPTSTDDCSSIMMHSNSMLFDPETDDTWEVPLSPLNDPEDIPWLDLSF